MEQLAGKLHFRRPQGVIRRECQPCREHTSFKVGPFWAPEKEMFFLKEPALPVCTALTVLYAFVVFLHSQLFIEALKFQDQKMDFFYNLSTCMNS